MRKGISMVVAAPAHAQLRALAGKWLGLPENGVPGGAYRGKNEVRTFIAADPYDPIDLYGEAIAKAAEMTLAKGFRGSALPSTAAPPC